MVDMRVKHRLSDSNKCWENILLLIMQAFICDAMSRFDTSLLVWGLDLRSMDTRGVGPLARGQLPPGYQRCWPDKAGRPEVICPIVSEVA